MANGYETGTAARRAFSRKLRHDLLPEALITPRSGDLTHAIKLMKGLPRIHETCTWTAKKLDGPSSGAQSGGLSTEASPWSCNKNLVCRGVSGPVHRHQSSVVGWGPTCSQRETDMLALGLATCAARTMTVGVDINLWLFTQACFLIILHRATTSRRSQYLRAVSLTPGREAIFSIQASQELL